MLPSPLASLAPAIRKRLEDISIGEWRQGQRLFLVGGLTRDCLLGLLPADDRSLDIDIAVEGSAVELVRRISAHSSAWSGAVVEDVQVFPRYGTAKLALSFEQFSAEHPLWIDFASCRSECYQAPGARPQVQFAGIEEDLWRRDFSVNAIAYALGESEGAYVDPCGGIPDIEARLLRVLHDRSFEDDPIRLLRGLRLAVRLGFVFEESTEVLFRNAMAQKYLEEVSLKRRFDELRKALAEVRAGEVLRRASECGMLRQLNPAFAEAYARAGAEQLAAVLSHSPAEERVYRMCALLPASSRRDLASSLGLGKRERGLLEGVE